MLCLLSFRFMCMKMILQVGNMMLEIRTLQGALDGAAMDAEHSGNLRNVHSGPIMSMSSFRKRNAPVSPGPYTESVSNRLAVSNQI